MDLAGLTFPFIVLIVGAGWIVDMILAHKEKMSNLKNENIALKNELENIKNNQKGV